MSYRVMCYKGLVVVSSDERMRRTGAFRAYGMHESLVHMILTKSYRGKVKSAFST